MRANRGLVLAVLGLGAGLGACLDLDILQGAADARDGSVSDLARMPDSSSPVDHGNQSGCAALGGIALGVGWACPGVYNATAGDSIPAAAERCAPGFVLCSSADGLDLGTCAGLAGFYVAAVPLRRPRMSTEPADLLCGAPAGSDLLMYAGCGLGQASEAVYRLATSCAGFGQAVDCSLSSSLSCGSASDLSTAAQYSAASGVLCCPR